MEQTKETRFSWKKLLKWIGIAILAVVLVAVVAVFAIWGNELSTLASFTELRQRNDEHLDGSVYYMEVKGDFYLDDFIAQGGVSSDSELIAFITEHITKGLIDMGLNSPEIGCSSFTAVTEDGDRLFARNYDFSKTNTCIVVTEANEDRHATISTVDLQFLSIDADTGVSGLMDKISCLAAAYVPLDGINDAGVSCGIYMSYQGSETVSTDQDTDRPDITSTTLLRLILDYADDVDEAVEIAQNYDLHDSANTSFHYMVADASGRSVILEWIAGNDSTDNDGSARELVVHYNDDDSYVGERESESDFQWITNCIVNPGYYDGIDASQRKGYDRYEQIYQDLSATNGVVADEWAAMDILETVGRRSWKNDDGNGCTVHSAVYNLTDKTMLWVSNENFDDPTAIYEFSFED